MSSDTSYASASSGSALDTSTTTFSSGGSSVSLQLNSCITSPTTTNLSSDNKCSPSSICSLDHEQLALLKSPRQLFSTSNRNSIPYTINSKSWYQSNYEALENHRSGIYLAANKTGHIWDSLHGTAGVVYGIAKVFIALCRSFRVDLGTPAGSLLTDVDRVERGLESGLVIDYIFAIEDLCFSLYARLEIEIALLHFCTSFVTNGHKRKSKTTPTLPEPDHVYTILTVCKKILKEEDVCSAFDDQLVKYHQRRYVEETNKKYKIDGILPLDYNGCRAHVYETIEDPSSHAYRHWCQLYPEIQHLSIDILAFLSEKYVPTYPRTARKQSEPLTRVHDLKLVTEEDTSSLEVGMVAAHRLCTLAKIEGKAVGELRRKEGISNILRYASEQKCTCLDICACSKLCTRSGNTLCPCSSRWMRGITMLQPENGGDFRERSALVGELTYESLAALRRELPDNVVRRELLGGVNIIREEMIKQRLETQVTKEADMCHVP